MSSNYRQSRAEARVAAAGRRCVCGKPLGKRDVGRHTDGSPVCQLAPWELMLLSTPAPQRAAA
jgi:hypothetical protein